MLKLDLRMSFMKCTVFVGICIFTFFYYSSEQNLGTPTTKILNHPSFSTSNDSNAEVENDPTVRRIVPYRLDGQNIRWVEWENKCVGSTNITLYYTHFKPLICPGSNAIDIGAHSGDTAVSIAAATQRGETYAYEPHPKTFHILELQNKLNPALHLNTFNIALMKEENSEMWWSGVGDGCNGGIQKSSCGTQSSRCMKIHSENINSHFQNNLPPEFIQNLSFIKVDTEGNDRHLLRGLKSSILKIIRPLILIEWFIEFKNCNPNAKDMFNVISEIGYVPYKYHMRMNLSELTEAKCDDYIPDLLLFPKEWNFVENAIKICPNRVKRP